MFIVPLTSNIAPMETVSQKKRYVLLLHSGSTLKNVLYLYLL